MILPGNRRAFGSTVTAPEGVEALQLFFRHVPADLGLAYIVVMHLEPNRHSELPATIARSTTMPVIQVADRDQKMLAANHVYVIEPNRKLEVTDSSVASSPFEQPLRAGQRSTCSFARWR